MPLYDFICADCGSKFEALVASSAIKTCECPKCGKKDSRRQISLFRVGGRGDLRESTTFHGCHLSHQIEAGMAGHDHGHVHTSSCNHGSTSGNSEKESA